MVTLYLESQRHHGPDLQMILQLCYDNIYRTLR